MLLYQHNIHRLKGMKMLMTSTDKQGECLGDRSKDLRSSVMTRHRGHLEPLDPKSYREALIC